MEIFKIHVHAPSTKIFFHAFRRICD